MYNKQEAALLRQQFWTTLGQYLKPVPAAGQQKVNWINYKTGVRHISFTMQAEENKASLSIVLSHPYQRSRNSSWELLQSLRNNFESTVPGDWIWEASQEVENRVTTALEQVSVYRKEDWPTMIAFFKQGIVGLDIFWTENKDLFEMIS